MFELKKLNVHKMVATEEERDQFISQGYEEMTKEEFLKEIIKVEVPVDATLVTVEVPVDESEKGKA